jgi:hypothetical protein
MDITQKRQVSEEQRIFVNAVRWDERTPIELLGNGSQQAQLYPSDIDLFSAVKTVDVDANDPAEIYRVEWLLTVQIAPSRALSGLRLRFVCHPLWIPYNVVVFSKQGNRSPDFLLM